MVSVLILYDFAFFFLISSEYLFYRRHSELIYLTFRLSGNALLARVFANEHQRVAENRANSVIRLKRLLDIYPIDDYHYKS